MPKSKNTPRLSVVPDPPKPEPFPPHLRPAAQAIWDILTSPNIESQESRLLMAEQTLGSQTGLSPEEKTRIWNAVTDSLASPTPSPPSLSSFGLRPSSGSAETSPQKRSSNTSPPDPERLLWTQPPDFNWIAPDDVPAFTQDTTRRMLILLNDQMGSLSELLMQLKQEGREEHALMIEKKITLLNLLRLETIEINLASLPEESDDLLVVDNRLTDQHGRPLTPA